MAPTTDFSLPAIPEQGEGNEYVLLAGGTVIFTVKGLELYRQLLAHANLPASKLNRIQSRQDLRSLHVLISEKRTQVAALNLQTRLKQRRLDPAFLRAGALLLKGRLRASLRMFTSGGL